MEGAGHDGFGSAAPPGNDDAAQARIDGEQEQGRFNRILADNGRQGKGVRAGGGSDHGYPLTPSRSASVRS